MAVLCLVLFNKKAKTEKEKDRKGEKLCLSGQGGGQCSMEKARDRTVVAFEPLLFQKKKRSMTGRQKKNKRHGEEGHTRLALHTLCVRCAQQRITQTPLL